MSNCCLFENVKQEPSRKLYDSIPVERVVEEISRMPAVSVPVANAPAANTPTRLRPTLAKTHEMSIIRPQPALSRTGRALSKSARVKPKVQAFFELMLAAASLLFLALS